MSENNTTELKNEQPAMVKTVNKPRMSKVPVLLAILSLSCTGYLAYQSFLGINGFIAQNKLNSQQSQKIAALSTDNLRLTQQIKQLTQEQTALKEQVDKTNKTVNNGNMVLYQLNSLISGANQSLLLYHDYASAIKQLNYANDYATLLLFLPCSASTNFRRCKEDERRHHFKRGNGTALGCYCQVA